MFCSILFHFGLPSANPLSPYLQVALETVKAHRRGLPMCKHAGFWGLWQNKRICYIANFTSAYSFTWLYSVLPWLSAIFQSLSALYCLLTVSYVKPMKAFPFLHTYKNNAFNNYTEASLSFVRSAGQMRIQTDIPLTMSPSIHFTFPSVLLSDLCRE